MKPIEHVPQALQAAVSAVPKDVIDQLTMKMAELQAALEVRDPMIKHHLQEIHRTLIGYPETVHLLDNNGIRDVLAGQQELMKIQIVSNAAKKTGASKKKVSIDDL